MLGLILPIWRSKSILMRAEALSADVCSGRVGDVAELRATSGEESRGNAAAPTAAARPSFRKLRRAGSLMVIEVSPFSSCVDYAYSEAGCRPPPQAGRERAPRVSMGKRVLVNRGFCRRRFSGG